MLVSAGLDILSLKLPDDQAERARKKQILDEEYLCEISESQIQVLFLDTTT